jgi:hypothetical protein
MTAEHQEILRAAIIPLDTAERRAQYRSGNFPRADAVQDLDKRYRWDLLWASGAMCLLWDSDADYKDAHIDTALRSVVPSLRD